MTSFADLFSLSYSTTCEGLLRSVRSSSAACCRSAPRAAWVGLSALAIASQAAGAERGDAIQPLEEIVVTAALRPESIQNFPASTTVLDASTLRAAGKF